MTSDNHGGDFDGGDPVKGVLDATFNISGDYDDQVGAGIEGAIVQHIRNGEAISQGIVAEDGSFDFETTVPTGLQEIYGPDFDMLKLAGSNPVGHNGTKLKVMMPEDGTLNLHDINGNLVSKIDLDGHKEYLFSWGGQNLPPGLYIAKVVDKDGNHDEIKLSLLNSNGQNLEQISDSYLVPGNFKNMMLDTDTLRFLRPNTATTLDYAFSHDKVDVDVGAVEGNVGPEKLQELGIHYVNVSTNLSVELNDFFRNDELSEFSTTNSSIYFLGSSLIYDSPTTEDTIVATITARDITDPSLDEQSSEITIITQEGSANQAPVAVDDEAIGDEDQDLDISVLLNDYDPDGNLAPETLNTSGLLEPQHGTITNINLETGVISYTPDANWFGTDTFEYSISDTEGLSDIGLVTTTILSVNDAPNAINDNANTPFETSVTVPVYTNDTDIDGSVVPSTVSTNGVLQPSNGTVSVDGNGNITYTPDNGFSGQDIFEYEIWDDGTPSLSDIAQVTIQVASQTNSPPVAVDDNAEVDEDDEVTIDVLANDSDPDGNLDPTSVETGNGLLEPSNGIISYINPSTGAITYIPNADFSGEDSFEYKVFDDEGLFDVGLVSVTVDEINDAPVAVDDNASTPYETAVVINVPSNDYDNDGNVDPTSVSTNGLLQASNGSISINSTTGEITYTPDNGFSGDDSFEYEISDDGSPILWDTAYVNVSVAAPGNSPPIAVDDTGNVDEDNNTTIDVLANDTDPDGNLDPTSVDTTGLLQPQHGSITYIDPATGHMTYEPDANFFGTDAFEYRVYDLEGLSDVGLVDVTVNSVNDAPVANDDNANTNEDTPVSIAVYTNDTDIDGNVVPSTVSTAGLLQPSNGITSVDGNGNITYTPNANWNGTDTFEYKIWDDGTPSLSDIALVTVNVNPVNDAPYEVTPILTQTINEDGSWVYTVRPTNVDDVDSPTLSYTLDNIVNATYSVNGDEITITPNADWYGTISNIVINASDGEYTTPLTGYDLVVVSVNDNPIAVNDSDSTNEDNSTIIDVLANDYDIDGTIDPTSVTNSGLQGPSHGSININGTTGAITYTPDADWFGTDNFEYQVFDNEGAISNIATVAVIVASVNDAPVAVDDNANTNEDNSTVIDVLANDYDIDGTIDPTSVTNSGLLAPSHGNININGTTGAITYTPDADWFGTDNFEYKVFDNEGLYDIANVTVTVNSVNDAPIAVDDSETTAYETPVSIDVLVNDYDIDGSIDPTSVENTGLLQASHGSISINGTTGAITYTPDNGYSGADSFEYKVFDDGTPALYDIALVNVTVNASTNQAPDAVDDNANTNEDNDVIIDVLANDSDPDGNLDPTSVENTGLLQPSNGTITNINGSTGHMTYEPDADWFGTDNFEYKVFDDEGLYDIANVTVTVASVNDAPIAVDDSETTPYETPVSIDVLANDSDPDGNLVPSSVTNSGLLAPSNGNISINSSTGAITYTPDNGYSGTDNFEYKVSDDGTPTLWDTAMVDVTVGASTTTQVTFYFKDAALDTDVTGETCTLYYTKAGWTQDSTKVSTTGQVTINMEVGDTYEIDGEHTGDWETSAGLNSIYTALERPGDIEAFEQRALDDQSSPMIVSSGEDTIFLYKLDDSFPMVDMRDYASYLNGIQEGIRKFSTSDITAPFWVDLSNGGQSLNTAQTEWYNDIKTDLASVPHVYLTLPLEQSATTPSVPHNRISINATNPPTPSNYTTFNGNHEIQVAVSLFNSNGFSEYDFKQEFFEALGDLNDVGGSPNILDGSSSNYTLNTTGRNIFSVMYLFKPGTKF